MKRLLTILSVLALQAAQLTIMAQPAKSRTQTSRTPNQRRGTTNTPSVSRADLMFPTAVAVPEDVAWRRDIYRSLDLTQDANAPLYFPVEPQGNDMNLFTLLFQLLNKGKIPAYEYQLSGIEDFSAGKRLHFKDLLEKYQIFYEITGNNIHVDNSDIPSAEVLSFNVKESSYYDQHTATYHSRIVAICPVLHRADDFSMEETKSPMFWVKYDDIATYLSGQMLMTSNINNAARMSIDDFFSTNHYRGTIYMTTNMQNKSLAQYCPNPDSLKSEQSRIEKEMADFEEHIWNEPVDSVALAREDSIANAKSRKPARSSRPAATTKSRTTQSGSGSQRSKMSGSSSKKEKSSSSGSAARVSVRRQRH